MSYTPNRLEDSFNQLEDALRAYQEYVHAEKILSEKKTTFLAALKMHLKKENEKMSDAALETAARATEDWKAFIETWKKGLRAAGRRWAAVEIARHRWETNRSLNSVWKAAG